MTELQRAQLDLEEAEQALARVLIANGDGRAPGHAVSTAQWWAEQCRKQVEKLSGTVTADG